MRLKPPLSFTPLLAILIALTSGCGKNHNQVTAPDGSTPSGGGAAMEQAQISSAMAQTPELIEDGVSESSEQATLDADGPAGAAALLHPLHYWRRIDSVNRTFEFAFSDTDSTGRPTRALVTIRKVLRGSFNILNDDAPRDSLRPDTSTTHVVRKRLADLWERHVLLRRVRSIADPARTEWKVAAVSGVKISSFHGENGHPVFGETRLVRLRIQSASGDTVINDPLALFRLRAIPGFQAGEDVTLTATTLRNDDVVVLIRSGDRRRFHNNGDNTYTIFWRASPQTGAHHVGVNALSRGTLFDDAAPYDSQSWLFPYLVKPEELPELMP
jgi:hypothetical protein